MDKIHIKEILLRCIIGINEEERVNKQDVVISVTLHTDLRKAGETDDFKYAIDYKSVKTNIIDLVENSSYFLLEALAEEIGKVCLKFEGVKQVDVLLEKPNALRFAKTVAVEISRKCEG